jgi:DNA (cytosine-5)-methyltransferase 1
VACPDYGRADWHTCNIGRGRGGKLLLEMKVLNLYACLGGNRALWTDCHVTAVELDPELARMYQERFQNDTVIIADAHQYLLDHYKEFDFIWSSPPCPSHSRTRKAAHGDNMAIYPDMTLYQEIIFLQHHFYGKYVVENVIPYYEPLIPAQKRGRHLYWANFMLPKFDIKDANIGQWQIPQLQKYHAIDISVYNGKQNRRKILRNMVSKEAGLTIFNTARGIINQKNQIQTTLFS